MGEVTRILAAIERGEARAAEELLPLVYDQLRSLAAQQLAREKPGQTLQATALVHEAWLRLVGTVSGESEPKWDGELHFFNAAAEAMRRILVESARRKHRQRHGGQFERVELDPEGLPLALPCEDLLALHEALDELAACDPGAATLVKLRFFAGLTEEQTAKVLGIPRRTASRVWAYARAWLYRAIREPPPDVR
jgi:RNA polymerase sigma factor (TIGR02999 family)